MTENELNNGTRYVNQYIWNIACSQDISISKGISGLSQVLVKGFVDDNTKYCF